MSHNSGDESGTASSEGAGAREGQRSERFGDVTPERRLQEFQLEMERLSIDERELTKERAGVRQARFLLRAEALFENSQRGAS
ncbi:hypothetical protein HPB50_014850 [Hyalomma asiaticum]|uniref:Uncharacterized protein n=1 Tax=Hyalomma asiaticum TaxID=266040 RepID=A0ACB7RL11_HYAAI|nr:hypothetical protein HPB50_014850 [Hyalomma asiaticum]